MPHAIVNWALQSAQNWADHIFALTPRSQASTQALTNCQLVAHRGDTAAGRFLENTRPAFDHAATAGVWGLELDIRWSKDFVPLVMHDADTQRIFGRRELLSNLTQKQIRHDFPLIPTLEEIIVAYGKKMHLMIEIKAEPFINVDLQKSRLKELTDSLQAVNDFHILALQPELFELVDFVPKKAFLPVAETNVKRLSQVSLSLDYGGLTGHYLLLSERLQAQHAAVGQSIGTGFITSPNCLMRELNRGVTWIFSNHAVQLQQWINKKI